MIFHGKKNNGFCILTHMVLCTLSPMPADSLPLQRVNYDGEKFELDLCTNEIINLRILPHRKKIVMNYDNKFRNKEIQCKQKTFG